MGCCFSFQGIGGFLPGVKQIANVAALPGIVGVRHINFFTTLSFLRFVVLYSNDPFKNSQRDYMYMYDISLITGLPMGKPSRGLRFVCLFSFFSFF